MHTIFALIVAVIAFVPLPSRAADIPLFPSGAEQREARLMMKVGPQTRTWIKQEARRELLSGQASESTAQAAAGTLPGIATADIEQLVLLIMMQVARDSDADLKAQMEEMKKINDQKQALRDQIEKTRQTANAPQLNAPAVAVITPNAATRSQTVTQPGAGVRQPPGTSARSPADTAIELTKNKLDSMSEMSEMTSLRLQMMMDRRSKFISTLSNIMKKISTTQDTLVQNLK